MNKILLLLLSSIFMFDTAFCQTGAFNPSVTVFANYNGMHTDKNIFQGNFKPTTQAITPGISFNNDFMLKKKRFLDIGFKINYFKTDVYTEGTSFYAKKWYQNLASIAIPIYIGQQFSTKKGNKGEVFAGVSLGVLFSVAQSESIVALKSEDYMISHNIQGDTYGPFTPTQRFGKFASFDLGGRYQPFHKLRRLEAGLMLSVQLTQSPTSYYNTIIEEYATSSIYNFNMEMKQRFITGSFTLTYKLCKLPKLIKEKKPHHEIKKRRY